MASIYDGFKNRATIIRFKDPITNDLTEFTVDCSLSINTQMSANVTEFPVEGQKSISDHIQPKPLTLRLDGFVSESPSQKLLTLANTVATGVILNQGQFTGLGSAFVSGATATAASLLAGRQSGPNDEASFAKLLSFRQENDPDYPKRAMLGLQKLFNQGITFDVRTFFSDTIYKNLAATSLSFTQTPEDGDSLRFSISCKKIITVVAFTETANEVRAKDPANSSAAKAENKGKVTKKPVNEASILAKGVDGIKDGLSSFVNLLSGG